LEPRTTSDYNAVGPVYLPGFADVGPREPTHLSGNVMPVRLDRCLAHRLVCSMADALDFGPSDHRPIRLELRVADGTEPAEGPLPIPRARPRGFYR